MVMELANGDLRATYAKPTGGKSAAPMRPIPMADDDDGLVDSPPQSSKRKGKLKNSQYLITLPTSDPRMVPPEFGPLREMSEEALESESRSRCAAVRCERRPPARHQGA